MKIKERVSNIQLVTGKDSRTCHVDGVTALPPLRLTPVHATVKWIGDLNGAGGGVM